MRCYFVSDLQFEHLGGLIAFNRPFNTVKEMNAYMIKSWNSRITPSDTVYICGDFSTGEISQTKAILKKLQGNKVLIFGNHDDELRAQPDLSDYFVDAAPMLQIQHNGKNICLCHYPMPEFVGDREGGWLICGHVHNRTHGLAYSIIMQVPTILNAGVDINNFVPVTFEELWQNNSEFYTPRTPLFF